MHRVEDVVSVPPQRRSTHRFREESRSFSEDGAGGATAGQVVDEAVPTVL